MGAGAVRADFADFYRVEFPRVYRAAYAVTGDADAARDLTQEAFARAFARWRRLARADWAGGWVMTTALNLAKRRSRRFESREVQPRSAPPSEAERVDLVRALRRLPARQRQALVLHYVGDLHPMGGRARHGHQRRNGEGAPRPGARRVAQGAGGARWMTTSSRPSTARSEG